jgi:hypothetical protein
VCRGEREQEERKIGYEMRERVVWLCEASDNQVRAGLQTKRKAEQSVCNIDNLLEWRGEDKMGD